ncbi:siderophore-interacting protein [Microbacterium sp. CJ88]|uniref:siderophore-interacting protein n=1 Tax=Microbacterium sp. CJ88 TaxID=3445672 RepID=UPI003F654C2F
MSIADAGLRSRPAYRPYRARVETVRRLSPHFVRVVLTADDFVHFGTAGLDQRIKLILPRADGTFSDIGSDDAEALADGAWFARWRATPSAERSPMRTYTVRRVDVAHRRVTVDLVVHADAGPAAAWAVAAAPGDELVLVGPDERSADRAAGIDWHPGSARRILLAGDETAVPAISGILESLDDAYDVDAYLEVPTAADRLEIGGPATARVHWIVRDTAPHGEQLTAAVAGSADAARDVLSAAAATRRQELDDIDVDRELLWDSPDDVRGEFYAWIAGEAATVKGLRRLLVQGHGVDRSRVAFMGYWRLGRAEAQD